MRKIVLFLMIAALFPLRALAVSPSDYAGLRWRMIGPYHGGRVPAVAGVASEPETYYIGAAGGGVWKTEDGGHKWQPVFDGQSAASIGALAVDPSDPKIVWAGTGECDMRSSIVAGNGIYKSIDAGKTWTHLGLNDTEQICRIVVDPNDSNSVYLAALGHAYGPNTERGVFHSADGGHTWQKILYKNADTGAIDIAMDPTDSKVLYAALWQTRRPPWNIYPPSNGPGSGLYKSVDGGATWQQLTNGLPSEGLGRITIGIARSEPQRVYTIVDAKKGGLYQTKDAGAHWKLVNGKIEPIWDRGWYFGTLGVDPQNPDHLYTGTVGFNESIDGGKKFQTPKIGTPSVGDYHAIWIAPDDPKRMIVGADQGAEVSSDGGKVWSSNLDEPIAEFYRIVTDNSFPYHVYAAQQDDGSLGLPSRTDGYSIGYHDLIDPGVGGENGYIAPDPLHPSKIYGGQGEVPISVNVHDFDTGQDGAITPTLLTPGVHVTLWTSPVVFSKAEPRALYFGQGRLIRTLDYGHSWKIISPDLTRKDPGAPPNLDPTTAADLLQRPRKGAIFTIAPSPLRAGTIWVGTTDGKIWLTRDTGKQWLDVTPPQLGAWSKVTLIDASPHDPNTAYAAIDRHRLDDFNPYLLKTHDGGRTWSFAVSGIPAGSFLNGIREDPLQRGLLYAATETAVYVSLNDGQSWHSLQNNMPVVSVRDVAVHGDDLVIGTHGRSWWILDNVTPLRQLARSGVTPYLFQPATALRFRSFGYGSCAKDPYGMDNGVDGAGTAPNPPVGAIIDYSILSHPVDSVRLDIFDAHGTLVRSYRAAKGMKYSKAQKSEQTLQGACALSYAPGMHRFVWDLHYASPAPGEPGVLAPPGRYQARVTTNEATRSAWLTVRNDPRVHVSDADLLEQFSAERAIEAIQNRVSVLTKEGAAAQKRLARLRKTGTAAQRSSANRLSSQIATLVGAAPVASPDDSEGPPEHNMNTIHYVGVTLSAAEDIVGSYDHAPPPYALASAQSAGRKLDALSAQLKPLLKAASAL